MNFDLFFYQTAACLTFIVKEKKDTCKHETNFQAALLKMYVKIRARIRYFVKTAKKRQQYD